MSFKDNYRGAQFKYITREMAHYRHLLRQRINILTCI